MKYRLARYLALALALGCAPRAVDRTVRTVDAAPTRSARDTGVEAPPRPELPATTDAPPAEDAAPPVPRPPSPPDAAADAPPDPVDAPPPRPDFSSAVAASCAGADPWQSGKQYEAGDTVVHGEPRRKFECRPWPNTPWCWLPEYEPGKNLFYDDAWIDQGACP
jgi:hypothetical protein